MLKSVVLNVFEGKVMLLHHLFKDNLAFICIAIYYGKVSSWFDPYCCNVFRAQR